MHEQWDRYAELDIRRRELEDELKAVEKEQAEMQAALLADMADSQCDKITLRGITFYPRRRIFAGPAEGYSRNDVADGLIAAQLGDYVKNDYNANALNGFVSAFDKESDLPLTPAELRQKLPEPLRACVAVGEKWTIASQKTAQKAGRRPAAPG